jgi:hypothetical protein
MLPAGAPFLRRIHNSGGIAVLLPEILLFLLRFRHVSGGRAIPAADP